MINNVVNYIRVIRTNQAALLRSTANTYRLGLKHSRHIFYQQGTLAVNKELTPKPDGNDNRRLSQRITDKRLPDYPYRNDETRHPIELECPVSGTKARAKRVNRRYAS